MAGAIGCDCGVVATPPGGPAEAGLERCGEVRRDDTVGGGIVRVVFLPGLDVVEEDDASGHCSGSCRCADVGVKSKSTEDGVFWLSGIGL